MLPDVLTRVINALTGSPTTRILILDDVHKLGRGPALASIAWFLEHCPSRLRVVLATRSEVGLPVAAMRARGWLTELRASDLRFTATEAQDWLVTRLGLELDLDDVANLVRRTEGWPAGLYLAALAVSGSPDPHGLVQRFDASNRHVVDYLVEEVLGTFDPEDQRFMLLTSVLDELCGPLCDAVLERTGSQETLASLSKANLFLVPVEDAPACYRFHPVFRQILTVERERRYPGVAGSLHARAAAWSLQQGAIPEAISHTRATGDLEVAADLVATYWPVYGNSGRIHTALGWIEEFPIPILHGDVRLLLAKAWLLSLCGDRDGSLEVIAALEAQSTLDLDRGPLPDGFSTARASLATLRAAFPWGDVGVQLPRSLAAAELVPPGSPWRGVVCWTSAAAHFFQGMNAEADWWFEQAHLEGVAAGHWIVAVSGLAYRSAIAGQAGNTLLQRGLANQARDLAAERGLEKINGEVHMALGRVAADSGDDAAALAHFEQGVGVYRIWGQPIESANALLTLATANLRIGDLDAARERLDEAQDLLDTSPDPGILAPRLAAAERDLASGPLPRAQALRGQALTEREVAVLRALAGAESERQIADALFVSFHTLHTHVRSIYRKLGVSTRSQAVSQARARGLMPADLT